MPHSLKTNPQLSPIPIPKPHQLIHKANWGDSPLAFYFHATMVVPRWVSPCLNQVGLHIIACHSPSLEKGQCPHWCCWHLLALVSISHFGIKYSPTLFLFMLVLFWFQQRNNLKHLTYSFASSFVTTFSLHSPPLGFSTFWIEASFWIYV